MLDLRQGWQNAELRVLDLPLTVELGRARLQIQDLLRPAPGSVIELDKSAGDPVELLINDRPIAKGEVVGHRRELRAFA